MSVLFFKITLYKGYLCFYCNELFTYYVNVKEHIYEVHFGVKTITCYYCSSSFMKTSSLNSHIKNFHCKNDQYYLKKYMNTGYSKSIYFKCDTCKINFMMKNQLKQHFNKKHKNDKNLKCLNSPLPGPLVYLKRNVVIFANL